MLSVRVRAQAGAEEAAHLSWGGREGFTDRKVELGHEGRGGQKVFQAEGTAYAKLTGLLMSFQVARPKVKARDFLSSTSNQTSTYKPLTKTQGRGKCVKG